MTGTSLKQTPMIRQYLAIKDNYQDAILFYRMGDFYEMFFEDAHEASRLLDIALTSRNKNDETPIPMCGVPVRAAQSYIARLIEHGRKVAVCEQVEDPATAKGLVKREVVRLITPGMIVENDFLDEKTNNYILAMAITDESVGISWLDISTGDFRVAESSDFQTAATEILRIGPSEMLLAESAKSDDRISRILEALPEKAVTWLEDRHFHPAQCRQRLLDQLNTLSLEGFGCEHLLSAIRAAGALLYYVAETQKQAVEHITSLETLFLGDYLLIDDVSTRNLELFKNIRTGSRQGTLISILDKTVTAMGSRLMRQWMRYPLLQVKPIRSRLDAVAEMMEKRHLRLDIREYLKEVQDLERLGSKISMGYANARDLTVLKQSLMALPRILELLDQLESQLFRSQTNYQPLAELADLIDRVIREDAPPTIQEGGIIREGYHPELDELIMISRDAKGWLLNLEKKEKEATGIPTLKVRYNKVFGYYIEVPKTQGDKVPDHYVRRQTLANAERFITDELKTFESKVLNAQDRRAALELEIFQEIRKHVVTFNPLIQKAARFVARLDCLSGLAEVAEANDYVKPDIHTKGEIVIEEGRHPVIEKMITGERFVPNTIRMDNKQNQVLIITGPNMAGKSTVLRQVALMVLMAQMGAFVPAKRASISVVDRIFTRVGALDNLSQGQSTFLVEMVETANILNNATGRSLVIMDEIGRGTSTFDGLSIAWAVAEYLHDLKGRGVKTLFATHYHELTELASSKSRVKNFNIAVKEWNNEIIFLRKLVEGGTNRSYGIQVARLAGIPPKVIRRATKVLEEIEKEKNQQSAAQFQPGDHIDLKTRHVQMNLFQDGIDPTLVTELKNLDLSVMTPLEALNYLHSLQQKLKQATNN